MTINEIKNCNKDFLTAEDVADVIHTNAQRLRIQARKDASKIPFPIIVVGRRVKIPKKSFVEFYNRCISNIDEKE